ncbi:enterochelin esterase domain-containing protein [Streptomyces sp. PTY087I2]|uniref:enterochelin esterase domain-containing protein n=1 Tax=Streptomyces sp. PTY087I2 TaxID=1819298 RepID=UPI00080BD0F8|nr:enterochelin esterase domain-containing protein [Streptomyces sp. PTY087I2]OCC09700.1 Enterochelin esterase [Streptomyces sp. PTY087I2]
MIRTAADAAPRPVTGPRIARLARQLEAARDAAARTALTEAFWEAAARTGTPLVEALDDAPGHRAVTFLWRGHRATRQVLLMATGIGDRDRPADTLLHHLPGTDIWYLGFRLRADHRASYRLVADISPGPAPDDPVRLQRRLTALMAHAVADPLNPRRLPVRWRAVESSVFALPEAPPQPWAGRREGIRRGTVERHTVTGHALGEEREVWTYLPPEGADNDGKGDGGGDSDGGPLPVVVLCDGDMWFGRLGFQDTLDALIADGALPPLVVLSPDAVDAATRRRDLGGREAFAAFLAEELLPWARARWPLTADADRTAVAGQGSAGTAALYAGLTRPDRFGRILAQSPSPGGRHPEAGTYADGTYGEDLPSTLAPVVHLGLGLHDGAASAEHGEALVPALRARGYEVHRTVHNGGRDHACWQGLLTEALVEAFR